MPRLSPALLGSTLAVLFSLAGCTFESRTDGGSPVHADNGAREAHRNAVDDAMSPVAVDPLGGAPSDAPVPTPRLGTVADGGSTIDDQSSPTEAALTPGGSTPAEATGAEDRGPSEITGR